MPISLLPSFSARSLCLSRSPSEKAISTYERRKGHDRGCSIENLVHTNTHPDRAREREADVLKESIIILTVFALADYLRAINWFIIQTVSASIQVKPKLNNIWFGFFFTTQKVCSVKVKEKDSSRIIICGLSGRTSRAIQDASWRDIKMTSIGRLLNWKSCAHTTVAYDNLSLQSSHHEWITPRHRGGNLSVI